MKKVLFVCVLSMILLAACSLPANPTPQGVSTQVIPTITKVVPASSTPVVSVPASSTPVVSVPASSTPVVSVPASSTPVAVSTCLLKDNGVLLLSRPMNVKALPYIWKLDYTDPLYRGCAVVFEGRMIVEERHHVIVLSLGGVNFNQDFDLKSFSFVEGSFWAYPTGWNIQDIGMAKLSIGEEFVWAKRIGMIKNVNTPYNWEIILHRVGSAAEVTYATSATVGTVSQKSCDFITEQPEEIVLTYLPQNDGIPFNASIGVDKCKYASFNGEILERQWEGTFDNYPIVRPSDFKVFVFPRNWNEKQIKDWIEKY